MRGELRGGHDAKELARRRWDRHRQHKAAAAEAADALTAADRSVLRDLEMKAEWDRIQRADRSGPYDW